MKKNEVTGLYEAYKLIVATGEEITGSGTTKAEAKADLAKNLNEYRNRPSVVPVGTFNSPGYQAMEENGIIVLKKLEGRTGTVWCRKDLEETVKELRAKDEAANEEN